MRKGRVARKWGKIHNHGKASLCASRHAKFQKDGNRNKFSGDFTPIEFVLWSLVYPTLTEKGPIAYSLGIQNHLEVGTTREAPVSRYQV